MLFGEVQERFEDLAKHIKKGSLIFLYNLTSEKLYGIFEATSDCSWQIEKNAWGGNFPWQIKVRWLKKFSYPLSKSLIHHIVVFYGGDEKRQPPKLIDSATLIQLEAIFKKAITYLLLKRILEKNSQPQKEPKMVILLEAWVR